MAKSIFESENLYKQKRSSENREMLEMVRNVIQQTSDIGVDSEGMTTNKGTELVAGMHHERLSKWTKLTEDSIFLSSKKTNFSSPKFSEPPAMQELYEKLYNKGFFDRLLEVSNEGTKKSQTGAELISNVIELNKSHNIQFGSSKLKNVMSINSLLESADNMKKVLDNGGLFATFDTETVSGVNAFGYNELNGITEFSFTLRKAGMNGAAATEVEPIRNLIGLADNEYMAWETRLKGMKGNYNLSENDKVVLGRWSKIGHPDTAIEKVATDAASDGAMWKYSKFTSADKIDIDRQIDYALEGIKRHKLIGEAQDAAAQKDGFTLWKDQFKRMTSVMNGTSEHGKVGIAGFNDTQFDVPVINRLMARTAGLEDLHISIPKDQHFDMLHSLRTIGSQKGGMHLYQSLDGKDWSNKMTKGLKPNQQEMLTRFTNPKLYADGNVAHVADFDEYALSTLFTDKTESGQTVFDVIHQNLKDIQKESVGGTYTGPNQQLFSVNQSNMFNNFNRNGGMNFTYDPLSQSYKTANAYQMGQEGVSKVGFGQTGLKKKGLYSFNVVEINTTEDYKKLFKIDDATQVTMPDYGVNKMFAVIANPVYDTNMAIDKVGHTLGMDNPVISLVHSQEQVEAILNNSNLVGTLKDGIDPMSKEARNNITNWIPNTEALKHPNLAIKNLVTGADGKVNVSSNEATLNDIFEMSLYRNTNEPAANLMRTMNFSKYEKTKKFLSTFDEQLAKVEETDPAKRIAKLAESISKNQPLTLEFQEVLGFNDFSKGGAKTLYSETLKNSLYVKGHLESMSPLLDEIHSAVEQAIPFTGTGAIPKEVSARRNYAFSHGLDAALEHLGNNNKQAIINGSPAKVLGEDIDNVLQFSKGFLFDEPINKRVGTTIAGQLDDVANVRLDDGYNLLSSLYNKDFKDLTHVDMQGNPGFDRLYKFANKLKKMPEYRDAFDGLNINEFQGKDTNLLSSEITQRLRNHTKLMRSTDSGFGLLNRDVLMQDVLTPHNLVANLDQAGVRSVVDNVAKPIINSAPQFKTLGFSKPELNDSIQELMNIMMPVKKDDYMKSISHLNNIDQKTLLGNFDLTYNAVEKKATDILEGVAKTDMTLALTKDKNNTVMLLRNNLQEVINLPVVNQKNGFLFADIDGSKHIIQSHLDMSGVIGGTFDPTKVKYMASYEKAMEKSFSFSYSLGKGMDDGKDVQNQFISALKNFKQNLRDTSPRISTMNAQMFQEQLEQNVNDLVRALPELNSHGMINQLKQKGLVDDKFEGYLKKLLEFKGPIKDRVDSFSKMTSTQRNAFAEQGMIPLMQLIGQNTKDSTAKHFLLNATTRGKDTHLTEGKLATGSYILSPMNAFNNQARPPVTQFQNLKYYDKAKVAKELERQNINSNVSLNPLFVDEKSSSLMTNVVDKTSGQTLTSSVGAKHVTIDNDSLRKVIVNEKAKEDSIFKTKAAEFKANPEDTKKIQKLLEEKAMQANTYEQEVIIDSRLHDAIFYKMDLQEISAKKDIQILHENALITLEQMKTMEKTNLKRRIDSNGNIIYEYTKGKQVKEGDHLFRVGGYADASQAYVAKYNGITKGGYFNEFGELIDEKTINEKIKGLKNFEQATDKLNELYDFKYYVLPQTEHYGSKIFQDAGEKGVADAMKFGAGSLNPQVAKTLKEVGLGDEVGIVHYKDYLDQHIYPTIKSKLGKDADNVISMMEKERHIMGDIMFRGIDKLDHGASFLVNQNIGGHGNYAIPIKSALAMLQEEGKLTDDIVKDVFGIKGVSYDSVTKQIKVPSNMDNSFIDVDKLKGYIGEKGIPTVKDSEGNVIASIGHAEFTQVFDYSGGTHIGNTKEAEFYQQMKTKQSELDDLRRKAYSDDSPGLKSKILHTEKEITDAKEQAMARSNFNRGLKYSDRSHGILNRMRYDDEYIARLKNELPPEEFNKIAGHLVDENGALLDSYRGTSINSPFTDRMKKALLEGQNELQLKDIAGDNSLEQRYGYLAGEFSNKNISIKKAETMYSIGAGTRAMEFNESTHMPGAVQELLENKKYKFHQVGINDLALDIKGQASTIGRHPDNPYTNNVLVDLGEEFGQSRYLAVGRSIDKRAGENLIKEDHVQMLNSLQKQVHDFQSRSNTPEEKSKFKEKVLTTISDFKAQQKADISSKNGLAGDAIEVRFNQSHLGKGAGLTMNLGGNSFDEFGALSTKRRLEILGQNNSSILSNAMFEDKSIMQHYAEGKYFDAQFRSTKAFEDMGYFDDSMLSKRLGIEITDANRGKAKQEMMGILETHGDMAITTRFPEIQEGSVKPSMIYLNRELADNQAQAFGVSGLSMKLDYDGDTFFAARMASSDTNESYLDYVLKKGNVSKETTNIVKSSKVYMTGRAVGENRYFEETLQKALKEDYSKALVNSDFDKLTEGARIDGKLYSAFSASGDMTEEIAYKRAANVSKYIEQAKSNLGDNFEPQKFNDEVVNLIKNQNQGNEKDIQSLISDFSVDRKMTSLRQERVSKILKNTIGEANVTNYKLRKIYDAFGDSKAADFNSRGSILQSIVYEAEEGIISSKKAIGHISPDRAAVWNETVNNLLAGKDVTKNLAVADDWMKENLSEKISEQAEKLKHVYPSFAKAVEGKDAGDYMRANFLDTMEQMSGNDKIKKIRQSLNFGENSAGVKGSVIDSLAIVASANTLANETIKTMSTDGHLRNVQILDDIMNTMNPLRREGLEMIDGREWLRSESSTGQQVSNILKSSGEALANITKGFDGKSLAMGAVGLAGAFMVAGFVGGNPVKPADTHANEVAEDQFYGVPSLQDQDLNIMPSQQGGYVININARSKKGKEHVQQAIQLAMQNSLSTDVNVAMNINEQRGNITDREIERLLAGALNI